MKKKHFHASSRKHFHFCENEVCVTGRLLLSILMNCATVANKYVSPSVKGHSQRYHMFSVLLLLFLGGEGEQQTSLKVCGSDFALQQVNHPPIGPSLLSLFFVMLFWVVVVLLFLSKETNSCCVR